MSKQTHTYTPKSKTVIIDLHFYTYQLYVINEDHVFKHTFKDNTDKKHLSFTYEKFGYLDVKMNQSFLEALKYSQISSLLDDIHFFGHKVDKTFVYQLFFKSIQTEMKIDKNTNIYLMSFASELIDDQLMKKAFKDVFKHTNFKIINSFGITTRTMMFFMQKYRHHMFIAMHNLIYFGTVDENGISVNAQSVDEVIDTAKKDLKEGSEINNHLLMAYLELYQTNSFEKKDFTLMNNKYQVTDDFILSLLKILTNKISEIANLRYNHTNINQIMIRNNSWTRDINISLENKMTLDYGQFMKAYIKYADFVVKFNNPGNLIKVKKNHRAYYDELIKKDSVIYPTLNDFMSEKEFNQILS